MSEFFRAATKGGKWSLVAFIDDEGFCHIESFKSGNSQSKQCNIPRENFTAAIVKSIAISAAIDQIDLYATEDAFGVVKALTEAGYKRLTKYPRNNQKDGQ